MHLEGRRTMVMAGNRRREKMVGRVGCTKTAGTDGGGELEEWRKPERRGQRLWDWGMSQWSCSWSMITVAQRTGSTNLVAQSKLVSCS